MKEEFEELTAWLDAAHKYITHTHAQNTHTHKHTNIFMHILLPLCMC